MEVARARGAARRCAVRSMGEPHCLIFAARNRPGRCAVAGGGNQARRFKGFAGFCLQAGVCAQSFASVCSEPVIDFRVQ